MGKTVWKKLRSRKGASLTFALLAFLVCAVISAVLMASAMATSGRMSKLAETDRRYYAVTSAARLFCDALDGQSFTIERKEVQYSGEEVFVVTNETTLETGITRRPWTKAADYSWKITIPKELNGGENTKDYASENYSIFANQHIFLADAALKYVVGDYATDPTGAFGNPPGKQELEWDLVLTAAPEGGAPPASITDDTPGSTTDDTPGSSTEDTPSGGGSSGANQLQVNVHAKMEKNGSITLTFSNANGADKFYFTVTLKATVTDNSFNPSMTTKTESGFRAGAERFKYTEYTEITTTKVKTTTITWTVAEVGNGKEEASDSSGT